MKLKKFTQKDRYGNQMSYEFEGDTKQLDPNALLKNMMDSGGVPAMTQPPVAGEEFNMGHAPTHPGEPRGEDTIPAWLTPGEFVVNAEATEMFGPEIEAMNEVGRMAKGGMVPYYNDGGSIGLDSLLEPPSPVEMARRKAYMNRLHQGYLSEDKFRQMSPQEQRAYISQREDAAGDAGDWAAFLATAKPEYRNDGGYTTVRDWFATDDVLDALAQVESGGRHRDSQGNLIRSPAGALGKYQFLPKTAKNPGYSRYGVVPFDIEDEAQQREAARRYLDAIQVRNPEWSKEDVLRAYNWGEAASRQGKAGKRKMPKEAAEYPHKIFRELSKARGHETYFNRGGLLEGQLPSATLPVPPEGSYVPEMDEPPAPAPTFGGQNIAAQGQETKEAEFNKQLQYDSIVNAVQVGQLDPNQAREALKGMGGNWVGRFDSEARVGGVGESEGLAGNVAELAHNEIRKPFQDATGITELKKDARKVAEGLGLTDEKTVELPNIPQVATVETNPELDQTRPEAEAPLPEEAKTPEAKAESKDIDAVPNNEQKQLGEQAAAQDPSALDSVTNAFTEAFGNLFSPTKLAEAAIMYLGSRALGYSHGGSLNWAAKNYLGGVQAQQKAADTAALSGKYTKDSVKAFRKSGRPEDLVAKPVAPKRVGAKPQTWFTNDGNKKITAYEYEDASGNKYLGDQRGQPLDGTKLHQNADKVKGTEEYNKRLHTTSKYTREVLKDLQDRRGKIVTDKGTHYKTDLVPSSAADEVSRWAVTNDISPEDLGPVLDGAYSDMIAYAEQSGKKPKSIRPFLNQMVIRNRVSQPDLFLAKKQGEEGEPPRYVDSEKLAVVNSFIASQMGTKASDARVSDVANQYYNAAMQEWGKLSDAQRAKYNGSANDNENGFYVYIAERLGIDDRRANQ